MNIECCVVYRQLGSFTQRKQVWIFGPVQVWVIVSVRSVSQGMKTQDNFCCTMKLVN